MLGQRLRNQGLLKPQGKTPADVVRALGAVQAQDYAGARWAVGQRMPKATDAAVAAACDAGDIIRTHILRPTWHFVAPEDLRWMQALTGLRVHSANASWYRLFGMDAVTLSKSRKILERILRGHAYLTRTEIGERFEREGIPGATGGRLAALMMHAELECVVCNGPTRGKQSTYALVDERVPASPVFTVEERLGMLATRYFSSHGPATLKDFVWWSGLTVGQAREAIALTGSGLVRASVGDTAYWSTPTRAKAVVPNGRAWLLPNYDEYSIAYKNRELTGSVNGTYPNLLMIDGMLAGTWGRKLSTKDVIVEVRPFRKLSASSRKAVVSAVNSYGAFLGRCVILSAF